MTTRWNRYFARQQEDPEIKEMIEQELATLRLGTAIAKIREQHHLTQTQLAARAGMSASKISALEIAPKNVEVATLIRIAAAFGYRFKAEFVPARTKRHMRSSASKRDRYSPDE